MTKIVRHPSYSSNPIDYDLAILCLEADITPGLNAGIIPVASSPPPIGAPVTVTGWGRIHSNGNSLPLFLQQATNLTLLTQKDCESRWSAEKINERMLCAFSKVQSTCTGDSGGPLVYNGELVGVVSWGSAWCLHPSHPSVFTNVSALYDWIEKTRDDPSSSNSVIHPILLPLNPLLVTSIIYNYFVDKWYSW